MNNYTKGTTFYRGEGDGLIYASKEAAQKSQLSPNQKAYTYTNGKMCIPCVVEPSDCYS